MPDEYTRKRSRSPTENFASPPKHKRANTGNSSSSSHPGQSKSPHSTDADRTMNGNGDSRNGQGRSSLSPPPRSATNSAGLDHKSSASTNGDTMARSESGRSSATAATEATVPPLASIHMRCLIVTQDASIIIGRSGTHVNEIRDKSGARVVVSESIPGNPERILNVSGPLDAVSKVCLLHLSCAIFLLMHYPSRLLA